MSVLSANDLKTALSGELDGPAAPLADIVATLASPDPDARALCAQLLGNLARTEAFRTPLAESGALPPLVALLPASSPLACRSYAVRALANLTYDHPANRQLLLGLGAAPLVAALLSDADADAHRFAAAAAGNFASECPDLALALVEAGAVEPLLALVRAVDPAAGQALRAVGNIAGGSAELEERVRAAGAVAVAVAAVSFGLDEAVGALSTFANSEFNAAANKKEIVAAGAVEGLVGVIEENLAEQDEEDEDEEDGDDKEAPVREATEAAELLAVLCNCDEGANALAPLVPRLLDVLRRSSLPGPLRSDARKNTAECLAAACAHGEAADDSLAAAPEDAVAACAAHKDPRARLFVVTALASAATNAQRALQVATKAGRAIVALVADAQDGDAPALRALAAMQNLTVAPESRALMREFGAVEAVAGVLARLKHPLMLFPATLAARHLLGDGADVARALAAAGACEALGQLARTERGVPDPSTAQELDEDEKPARPAESTPRDVRVAYEASRVGARMSSLAPELGERLLKAGIAAGWALMAQSPYDVLVGEAADALQGVTGAVGGMGLSAEALSEILQQAALAVGDLPPLETPPSPFRTRFCVPSVIVAPFGHFRLLEQIGKGASAQVFKALWEETGVYVAVKSLSLKSAVLQSVLTEVNILSSLSHPNIIRVLGYHKQDECLFLFMEFAEKGSLLSFRKTMKAFTEDVVRVYAEQTLRALCYLHECNVVHRDVKAANVLLTKSGEVKLADFGLACNNSADKHFDIVVAPEVVESLSYSKPADIWSFGCTVYELVTGVPPFYDLNSCSVLYKISQSKPPIPKGVSLLLRHFLEACFEKDPEKRPTADDLLHHPWFLASVGPAAAELRKSLDPEKVRQVIENSSEDELLLCASSPTTSRPGTAEHHALRSDSSDLSCLCTVPRRRNSVLLAKRVVHDRSKPSARSDGSLPRRRDSPEVVRIPETPDECRFRSPTVRRRSISLFRDSGSRSPVRSPVAMSPLVMARRPQKPSAVDSESELKEQVKRMAKHIEELEQRVQDMELITAPVTARKLKAKFVSDLEVTTGDACMPGQQVWSMLSAGGRLWVGTGDGCVIALAMPSCTQISCYKLHDRRVYSMVAVGDRVWCSSESGCIYCILPSREGSVKKVQAHDGAYRMIKCLLCPASKKARIWSCAPLLDGRSSQIAILSKTRRVLGRLVVEYPVNTLLQAPGVTKNVTTVWLGCFGVIVAVAWDDGTKTAVARELFNVGAASESKRVIAMAVGEHRWIASGRYISVVGTSVETVLEIVVPNEVESMCLLENIALVGDNSGNVHCYDALSCLHLRTLTALQSQPQPQPA
eukprot:m51a1_g97 putative ha-tagged protein kinase domain of mitogen-activated protein kinase kinase kinase (1335) ;mRNA; f:301272-306306